MSDFGISNDGTPGNGQGASNEGNQFDFQQGYNQLRPEYTRTTQELSQAQQRLSEYEAFMEAISDPETQAEALASLGFEMETGAAPVEEYADPLEQEVQDLRSQVETLRGRSEQEAATREESQLLEMRDNFIGEVLGFIEEQNSMKFDTHDEEVLGNLAIAMTDDDGVPDVQGAFDALYGDQGLLERQRQQWIDSKVGAYSAPWGSTIPDDKKPDSAAGRIDFVDRRLRQMGQFD